MNSSETARTVNRQRLIFSLLIVLLVVGSALIYAPAMRGTFIWDDEIQFSANRDVASWKGIIDIWTTRRAMYFPLVLTTGWGIHKVFGMNPLAFHAVSLAFHVGAALLLVLVLKRLRVPGAWIAGFLFAWHPMQVESVGWIAEMKNTQAAFLMLLSVWALYGSAFFQAPFPRTKRERWLYRLSVSLFILAVLSKPAVVMLPVALIPLIWWKRGIRRWSDIDGLFGFVLVSVVASGWTIWEQRYSSGAFGFEWTMPLLERFALAGQIVWFYLFKLIWPEPVMFFYPRWDVAAHGVLRFLPFLALIALASLLVNRRKTWGRYPAVILTVFAAFIFPVAGFFNVYFMRYAWVADHFVYFAAMPVFAAAGACAAGLVLRRIPVGMLLSVFIVGACAFASNRHAHAFAGPEALWRDSVEKNEAAWVAHNNLGLLYQERGDFNAAEQKFLEALSHNPKHYEAMNNLGVLYQRTGKKEEALAYYDQALALRPELYNSWLNRGNLLIDFGDTQGAYASLDRAAEIRPDEDIVWVNMALLAEREQNGPRAFKAYYTMLKNKELNNEQIGAFLYERAYNMSVEKRFEIALYFLNKAADLAPGLADIYLLRGILHERLLDYASAEKSYRMALHLRSDWGAVLVRLSRLLASCPDEDQRQPQEALAMTGAMMRAGGDQVPEIMDAHAIALAANGAFDQARALQEKAILASSEPRNVEPMQARLRAYEAGQPYRLPD